jgi:aspartate kinase
MLIVQKYGGTSVATTERIRAVAERALETQRAGHRVAVVVSAMAGETKRLLGLAAEIQEDTSDREVDVIVATGEQVTVGLLALAIRGLGGESQSLLGHQVKLLTDNAFSRARIRSIDADVLEKCFSEGKIPVIAGFQGMDDDGNITTLGRGGSDTTAVAIAAAVNADVCEIYTDVDGVYTTDPNVVTSARKIERISYEEMLELASLGAKVLQIRSVEFAMKYDIPLHVRSSFDRSEGTWVVSEEELMEQVVVSGVTVNRDEAKITVRHVPDVAGVAARLLKPLSEAGIVVDMIIQNQSVDGYTDMSFTVPRGDRKRAIETLSSEAGDLCDGGDSVQSDDRIAKVSVVGVGMRSHSGVAMNMFELLAAEGINIQMITTSEIKISCIIEQKYAELALRTLHDGFGLHLPPEQRAEL